LATAMYWSGYNPMGMKPLYVAKDWKDRKIQQALLQPNKPQHHEILRDYLRKKRIEGGVKTDYGTCDSRAPMKPKTPKKLRSPEEIVGLRRGRPFAGRSIVEPPKSKMGKKLLLDSR